MKTISAWASHHRSIAVTLIVAIKLSLLLLAVYTGILLFDQHIIISPLLLLYAAVLLIIAAAYYPSIKRQIKKSRYVLRKSCDFVIAAAAFVAVATISNNQDIVPATFSESNASIGYKKAPSAQEILSSLAYRDKASLTHKEKKVLRKEFFKELKVYAKAKISGNKKEADHAGAILLAILAAIGLLFLLTGLVCSLSCGGSDVAAIIVALLGLTGIIVGLVFLIKRIKHGPPDKKKTE